MRNEGPRTAIERSSLRHSAARLLVLAVLASVTTAGTCQRVVRHVDFSKGLPHDATLVDLELRDGALELALDGDGSYVPEGYVEIPLPAGNQTLERAVRIDADRIDSLFDGDFEAIGEEGGGIVLYGRDPSVRAMGGWFSSAKWASKAPRVVTDAEGSAEVALWRRGPLEQFLGVEPGLDHRLAFDLDPTGLFPGGTCVGNGESQGPQNLLVDLRFYDASLNPIEFRNPADDATTTSYRVHTSSSADGPRRVRLRFQVIDCQERAKFIAEEGSGDTDVDFSYCTDPDGAPHSIIDLENTHLGVYDEADIRFAAVSFEAGWFCNTDTTYNATYDAYEARIDNVSLDREDQLEVVLLDESRDPLQSSVHTDGFRADVEAGALRIYLRSLVPGRTPRVHSLTIADSDGSIGIDAGAQTASFDIPRLGFTGQIGPRQEWSDSRTSQLRTLCADPFAGDGSTQPCPELLIENGVSRWRVAANKRMNPQLDVSGALEMSIEGDPAAIDPEYEDGESWIMRYAEMADRGFTIQGIAAPSGLVDTDLELKEEFYVDSYDVQDVIDLHLEQTEIVAALFDGAQTLALSNGLNVTLPAIDDWQVFVETNLDPSKRWYRDLVDDAEHVQILNEMAQSIGMVLPGASVTTSVAPKGGCFDLDYFDAMWGFAGILDAGLHDTLGVNTFPWSCEPEAFDEGLEELRSTHLPEGWADKTLSIGAFSETRERWDPACSTGNWERGHGPTLFAKRIARLTLSNLALPARDVYYYAPFDDGGWKTSGSQLVHDACWRTDTWPHLFERRLGTGILGDTLDDPTAGADEPTVFDPNEGGVAFLTIARYLSTSSPVASTTSPLPTSGVVTGDDRYNSTLFQLADGSVALALWYFRDYAYGSVYMDYLTGARDEGYTERRVFDVEVSGVRDVTGATLVPLDGAEPQTASAAMISESVARIPSVSVGEMPILVLLDGELDL